jgi:hypothetical protein
LKHPTALQETRVNAERLEQLLLESNGNLMYCVAFGVDGLHARTVMTEAGIEHCKADFNTDPDEMMAGLTDILTKSVQREMARVMTSRKKP